MASFLHKQPCKFIQELVHTLSSMHGAYKLQHTQKHTYKHTHRAHFVLLSILSVSRAAADTKHSLSLLLLSFPLCYTVSSPLLPSRSVLLSFLSSSPLPVSWAAAWSGDQRPRSRSFFIASWKWREREGTDNNGRVREDEREEEHKYCQQALITQMRFDSRHKPLNIRIWKIDR